MLLISASQRWLRSLRIAQVNTAQPCHDAWLVVLLSGTCIMHLCTLLLLLVCITYFNSTIGVAVVFKMHYSELLSKEDEIARLKAIIEGLSTNK